MCKTNQPICKLYACSVEEFQRKPYTRQLTVSYLYQSGKFSVPFIRLCGKWLKDAGFSTKDKIRVIVKDNLLVLEPVMSRPKIG